MREGIRHLEKWAVEKYETYGPPKSAKTMLSSAIAAYWKTNAYVRRVK
jgi:AAA+ superfamily predicted ATPase